MSEMKDEGDFEIVSLNVSTVTGTRKKPVDSVVLEIGRGVAGDAHAGLIEERQISLLAVEEIEKASTGLKEGACSLIRDLGGLKPGDFAENITTRGLELHLLPLGTMLKIGGTLLEVSKIGKECHASCEIRRLMGECVMPTKGIFARVVEGGEVRREDRCHYCIR
ncbi:MAG: MOSC domain-containing protein [Spirochaetes bacterium]|nr:MOSC domain-containing protein [Spirochaetota bacterium]